MSWTSAAAAIDDTAGSDVLVLGGSVGVGLLTLVGAGDPSAAAEAPLLWVSPIAIDAAVVRTIAVSANAKSVAGCRPKTVIRRPAGCSGGMTRSLARTSDPGTRGAIRRVAFLKELIEAGQLKPVLDRRYRLNEVPDALRYQEDGHPVGKITITV